jgi:hypothetical protein
MVLHYNAGRQCAGSYILLRYHLLFWIGRVGVGVVGRWRLRGLGGCWLRLAVGCCWVFGWSERGARMEVVLGRVRLKNVVIGVNPRKI